MTSVFMIFEITQDYQILVPLMVANMLSFVISRRFQPVPVYHALLHQDGVHLPSPGLQGGTAAKTARHVMRTDTAFIAEETSVASAWQWALAHEAPAYLVGTRDRLAGVVTHQQLEAWQASEKAGSPIGSVIEDPFVHTHPDQPLDIVLERLSESGGILPVVSRAEVRRVEGVVTRDSLFGVNRRSRSDVK
jgi:CIC family chloride channel protein